MNDPTESLWEVVVDDADPSGFVSLELVPRGFEDTRFAYRVATVPASSHATVAAALALLAPQRGGAGANDVVWDPFVGAGAELVERARFGSYASLIGTDISKSALEAARQNMAAAGLDGVTLALADATAFKPKNVSLILTNPPMGRRVERGTHRALLERFVDHAARVLVPGGALVWLAPDAALTARAEQAGLRIQRSLRVDMGGFTAHLNVHHKS